MQKLFTLSILFFSFLFTAGNAAATTGNLQPDSGSASLNPELCRSIRQDPGMPGKYVVSYPKNNLKINLSSLVLNNYSFSYERSLTKKISFVAGYRFMPETAIGSFKVAKLLVDNLDVDNQVRENLDNFKTSNQAYTGEIRFYSGKKPGARGLYLSLYGRYAKMQYDLDVNYEFENNTYQFPIQSNVASYGAGLMLGSQWLIAKRVVLDWYIIGGHYGKLTKGSFEAIVDIEKKHQAEIEESIEEAGTIGSTRYIEATVTDKGVMGTLNGPILGFRGLGFSLGIAF